MDITVAICTWNRAALLDATLAEMRKLRVPAGVTWELLVVDNNCTDETAAIIGRYEAEGKLPIRRLFEAKPGHSNARNCAGAAAQGKLLVWTDDDVLVDTGWLEAYWEAAMKYPQAVYFGGTVDPLFEATPPRWVKKNMELVRGPFALRQISDEVRRFEKGERPFGANMAFRRGALPGLTFDPKLGRVKESLISGDDIAVIEGLRAAGHEGVWVGTAKVRHWIPKKRMTKRYVWEWYVGSGRTMAREQPAGVAKIFGMPRWAVRKFMQHGASWCLGWFAGERRRMEWWRTCAAASGVLMESRRLVKLGK